MCVWSITTLVVRGSAKRLLPSHTLSVLHTILSSVVLPVQLAQFAVMVDGFRVKPEILPTRLSQTSLRSSTQDRVVIHIFVTKYTHLQRGYLFRSVSIQGFLSLVILRGYFTGENGRRSTSNICFRRFAPLHGSRNRGRTHVFFVRTKQEKVRMI